MENSSKVPTICVVGRPNVGKSSLFNYLMGERRAVVVEQSGTTRDRVEAVISLEHFKVKLVDTGGYLTKDDDKLSMLIKEQIYRAMEESAVIILVVDIMAGMVPSDEEVSVLLRKFSKPVILVANKTDNEKVARNAAEFYQLGFGEPVEISCAHRRGLRKLKRKIRESLPEAPVSEHTESDALKIAIVGRPNVGKSSLINNILKRERVIVSDIPGTTRDSIDTFFNYDEDDYILIDTAGMRHRRKVKTPVDTFSIMRSKESIKRSDVTLLLLDAADGVTRDDVGILEFIEENGKACMILINKWDLAEQTEDVTFEDYKKHLLSDTVKLEKFPIVGVSAKSGKNVLKSLVMARVLDAELDAKVSTPFLNKIFEKHDPGNISIPRSKKRPNFLYIIQSSKRPVEFKYFVNETGRVLPIHLSFIENQLRANLPLSGIPIKILIRKSRKVKK